MTKRSVNELVAELVAAFQSGSSDEVRQQAAAELLQLALANNTAHHRVLEYMPSKNGDLRRGVVDRLA